MQSAFADDQSCESATAMAIRMHTAVLSKNINEHPYDATSTRTPRDLGARSKSEVADDETLVISSFLVDHDRF